jgi:hypothetical protein
VTVAADANPEHMEGGGPVTEGLVSWWKFEGDAKDSRGSDHRTF